MTDRDEGLLDLVLDLTLYAPLGALIEARTELPRLAAIGRDHLDTQLTTARSLGRFAVGQAAHRLPGLLDELRTNGLGVVFGGSAPARPTPAEPADDEPLATVVDLVAAPAVDELAIPDYDSLSAVQVVPRLEGLAHDELLLIRRYEDANRGRRTILNRVAELEAAAGS